MPEGNTIHRLAREHTRDLSGRVVRVSSPQGRFTAEAALLDRRRFRGAEAWGKHLFHRWSGDLVVHVHLGMAGGFYRFLGSAPSPRASVRMRLAVRGLTIDLIGPPTCEIVSEEKRLAILARLGPDPLRPDADPELAWETLRRRPTRAIGDALLDQRVVSGVGNIFRNEALFLLGIHPLRPSGRLTHDTWLVLWEMLRTLMRRGLRGRIRTVDPTESRHENARDNARGDSFYVYQQAYCRRCGSPIQVFPLSGRRMFACPVCQARGRKGY